MFLRKAAFRISFVLTLTNSLTAYATGTGTSTTNTGSTTNSTVITPAGDTIKAGDRLALKADATIFTAVEGVDGTKKPLCAPAGTIFRVDNVEAPKTSIEGKDAAGNSVNPTTQTDAKTGTTTTQLNGASKVTQTQTDNTLYVHIKFKGAPSTPLSKYVGTAPSDDSCTDSTGQATTQVKEKEEYTLSATSLSHYGTYRNGWTWGALAIPYKFEFHDHSFQAKPSAAAYTGYETWIAGGNAASVIAIGAGGSSQSTTTQPASGGTTTSPTTSSGSGTQLLYTVAVGEIFTLGTTFKGGLLVGVDWAGSGTGFKYEGHPWLAVTLGTGF
jgi:hypothetical protein